MMKKYETMLVTSAKLDEEASTKLVEKFKTLIAANGTLEGVDEWGKRRLAYPINKEDDGIYNLIHFESDTDFPAELDRVYKITDGVLRSLIIAKVEGMAGPKAKAEEAATEAKAEEAAPAVAEEAAPDAKAEEAAPAVTEEAAPEAKAEEAGEPVAEAPAAQQEASE